MPAKIDKIDKTDAHTIHLERKTEIMQTSDISYDSLLQQYENIELSRKASNADYDRQLADIKALLDEADKLGVKSKAQSIIADIGKKIVGLF